MELLRIAHNESRRKAIFSDVATSPFLVLEIWQELLLIVGRAHYALATRHMVDGSGERAVRTTAQPSQPDPRQIALKQGDIFRPAQKPKSAVTSVLQTVLDGPASASPPAAVLQAMRSAADLKAKAIKEADGVQAQVMGRIEAMPVGSRVASQAKGMSQGISGLVGRSWAQRKVRLVVPNLTPAKRAVDREHNTGAIAAIKLTFVSLRCPRRRGVGRGHVRQCATGASRDVGGDRAPPVRVGRIRERGLDASAPAEQVWRGCRG